MWTQKQIKNHLIACKLLEKIKNQTFEFIRKNKDNVTEKQVQNLIIAKYKENNLVSSDGLPIVGFNSGSATPHYQNAKNKKLKKNTLILIDIWARLNKKDSPFSDITWMAYYGEKIPQKIQNAFGLIIFTRDESINLIKSRLKKKIRPLGAEVDAFSRGIITKASFKKNILHSLGHSIGFDSPHGKFKGLNSKGTEKLRKNLGYTIEPGVYFKNNFGIRSEIDFYIDKNLKLIITTPIQRKIVKI